MANAWLTEKCRNRPASACRGALPVLAWRKRPCVNGRAAPLFRNPVLGARHEPLFASPARRRSVRRSGCDRRACRRPAARHPTRLRAKPQPPAQAGATAAQAGPARPAVKDPVVATVNGQPIQLSELEVAQQALPPQYRNMPLQAVFPALLDRIVDSKLVVADGRKNKITDDPAFKKRMAFVEDQVLQDFWLQREIAKRVTAGEAAAALPGAAEVDAGRGRGARAPHPGRDRGRGQGTDRRAQERWRLRQAREGEVDRQGVGRRRRRPRLVQEDATW